MYIHVLIDRLSWVDIELVSSRVCVALGVCAGRYDYLPSPCPAVLCGLF